MQGPQMITTEKLYEALELISKGITRPTKLSKAMGIAYRTYCSWAVMSNRGDERFLVTFNDEEMQWARAITLATKIALWELRGMLLQESIYGYDEVQTKDGQVVWQLDPAACAIEDLDLREMLYGRRDGLLVIDGKLQPVVVKKKAPFAQQRALLEAAFPDLRPSSTVNQTVTLNGQVGIGFAAKTDYTRGPPAIPPPPLPPPASVPELFPAPVDAEFNEVEPDDLEDLLGPAPAQPLPLNVILNVQAQPELMAQAEPTPVAATTFDAPPRRPARTPLEQSLYDELEKAKARKAQT